MFWEAFLLLHIFDQWSPAAQLSNSNTQLILMLAHESKGAKSLAEEYHVFHLYKGFENSYCL